MAQMIALRRIGFAAAGSAAGAVGLAVAAGTPPERAPGIVWQVGSRLARNVYSVGLTVSDYLSLPKDAADEAERKRTLHACHERGAQRLLDLCFANGGIYIKLGQHIGQLDHILPAPYVDIMQQHALGACPTSPYASVADVLRGDLGGDPDALFARFDREPLASASLAQVHRAVTHGGESVAVKVQHRNLAESAPADIATIRGLVTLVRWAFPAYDYRWLVEEVEANLPQELDFVHEAVNAQRCRANFKSSRSRVGARVRVPAVHAPLSSRRVLTMEFANGVSVTDAAALHREGLQPAAVAELIAQAFSEMIFLFGDVHCDPHAANMLVRRAPCGGPELVLLDHGLYRRIDDDFRHDYAALWHALIFADREGIRESAQRMNAGDQYAIFASMLTQKPWETIVQQDSDRLYRRSSEEAARLGQYAHRYRREITELLRDIPRPLLLLLKTNDCLRSLDFRLGRPLNTLSITARACSRALSEGRRDAGSMRGRAWALGDRLLVEWRLALLSFMTWYTRSASRWLRGWGRESSGAPAAL